MNFAEQETARTVEGAAADQELAQCLSAFMDGQANLDGVGLESNVIRERWALYHLIGDALREPTAATLVTAEFSARMSSALAREPAHGVAGESHHREHNPASRRSPVSRWRQVVLAWPGLAVAGAIASVVWVAQPLFELEQQAQQRMSVAQTESGDSVRISGRATPESDYVSAHRQMAGPIAVRQVAFAPGAE